jgi:hypothetical protein
VFVEMLENYGTPYQTYSAHQTYDLPDDMGAMLEMAKIGKPTTTPPESYTRFFERLDRYDGQDVLFLPFCGEFGHQIMTHIRIVHFTRARRKIVCCREGEQVLYPLADGFDTDWTDPIDDRDRVATLRARQSSLDWKAITARYPAATPIIAGNLSPMQELIAIEPQSRITFQPRRRGLHADIVMGIRHRQFAPERNWTHWQTVADQLTANGISFAVVGVRPTTLDLNGQTAHSADYDTDAAIELLENAKLYVGTDTGTSHLAATVGAPMLLFREVKSGSRDMFDRMAAVNRGKLSIVSDGWTDAQAVISAIRERLK